MKLRAELLWHQATSAVRDPSEAVYFIYYPIRLR